MGMNVLLLWGCVYYVGTWCWGRGEEEGQEEEEGEEEEGEEEGEEEEGEEEEEEAKTGYQIPWNWSSRWLWAATTGNWTWVLWKSS